MAASVFGPLIGGPLIDNFGWRSVFLVNLPVGLVGLTMAMIFVKESRSDKPTLHFDFGGAITLGIVLSSLVLVLDQGTNWGWTSLNSILCYAAMAVFAVIFYRIDSVHPEPIVDFKFFKIPAFLAALFNNFASFMGMMGAIFLLPVFVQTYMGYTATQTGFLFMPMAFVMMIASPIGVSLVGKVPARIVIALSTLVASIGIFLFFVRLDPRSTPMDIILPLSVMAFGLGFGMSQRTSIIAQVVPVNEIGVASSILALVRNIAGAFGISLFSTILNNRMEDAVIQISRFSVINSANPLVQGEALVLMTLKAQIDGFRIVFIIGAVIVFVAAILAYFSLNIKELDINNKIEIMVE